MKKLLVLLLTVFALNSCEKDPEIIGADANKQLPKVDVCHYDATTDTWETLSINGNALKAHLAHGDVEGSCEERKTYVPDDTFEQRLIDLGYDEAPLDDYVLTNNINTVIKLYFPEGDFDGEKSWYLRDLTGIEDFISLEVLEIGGNPVDIIDLSKNINLNQLGLMIWQNGTQNLDLTKNINIEKLSLHGPFSSLNLTENLNLHQLELYANLSELNLSKNLKLKSLSLSSPINNLDLRGNILLEEANLSGPFDINFTQNINLIKLYLYKTPLSSLDLSKNTRLTNLGIQYTQLLNLDLSYNTELILVSCKNNENLTNFNIKGLAKLDDLRCEKNQLLTNMDFSQNPELTILVCSNNSLTYLDLSNNSKLRIFESDYNQLKNISFGAINSLQSIAARGNLLSALNVTGLPDLYQLLVTNNLLLSINLEQNPNLSWFHCQYNSFESLDVSNNPNLQYFYCNSNSKLSNLKMKNGTYTSLLGFSAKEDPNLNCVEVDNVSWWQANWSQALEPWTNYLENCSLSKSSFIAKNNKINAVKTKTELFINDSNPFNLPKLFNTDKNISFRKLSDEYNENLKK